MINLTPEEREQIAREEITNMPVTTIIAVAAAKMGELAVAANSDTFSTTPVAASINGKNYNLTLSVKTEERK